MMAKKFERLFRNRALTPEEVARDADVRKQIESEYPPKRSVGTDTTSSLSELLKRSIRNSSKSIEEIASAAEVSPVLLTRFLTGERDIHVATADRLAEVLGLEIAAE